MDGLYACDGIFIINFWGCRWTRSNWAFLNEPPPSEGASNTYVTQFHVATGASSKSQPPDGIATN